MMTSSPCPWCFGSQWLCMHQPAGEDTEQSRFAALMERISRPILPLEADNEPG